MIMLCDNSIRQWDKHSGISHRKALSLLESNMTKKKVHHHPTLFDQTPD